MIVAVALGLVLAFFILGNLDNLFGWLLLIGALIVWIA